MNNKRYFWLILFVGSLLVALAGAVFLQRLDGPRPVLRFEYRSPQAVKTRLDFDYGNGWEADERIRWIFVATDDQWQAEELMLAQNAPKKMKMNLDPIQGNFELRNMRLLAADGSQREFPIEIGGIKPVAETDAYTFTDDEIQIAMTGEKVPSFSLPAKEIREAWDYSIVQSPFTTRLFRGWILFFFSALAIWGPCVFLRPRDDRE